MVGKIKIKQSFFNLKEKLKNPKTKKVIMIIFLAGGVIFLLPVSSARALEEASKAIDASNVDKSPLLNRAGNKIKIGVLAVTGLQVCTDPTAPPIKKVIAGTKLLCCGGYASANIISSLSFTPQMKGIASACCGISWLALSGLEFIDGKTNL